MRKNYGTSCIRHKKGLAHPIAIRYPRGRGVTPDWKSEFEAIEIGTGVQLEQGDESCYFKCRERFLIRFQRPSMDSIVRTMICAL